MAVICLRKCCCCNIKIGSILISILYLIIFTLLTSALIWFIINLQTWDSIPPDTKAYLLEMYTIRSGIDNPDDNFDTLSIEQRFQIILNTKLDAKIWKDEEDWLNKMRYEYNMDTYSIPVVLLIVSIVNIITSISLITGVVTNKSSLFIPHLITNMIFMVIFIFAMNFAPISVTEIQGPGYMYILIAFVVSLIMQFIPTGLFIYMWIVVYSHYCVLKEENARGQYDKQVCRS